MSGNDTVAAVATAPGRAGVAVVRVSGPDAFVVASRVCGNLKVLKGDSFPRVSRAVFRNPISSQPVDDGVALFFKAPNSYTGENVVEFQCHAGSVAPRRVLEAALAAGARLATRGEFTQRALLNGKIDFSQAEGVLSMIDALTDRAADAALDALSGKQEKARRSLYEEAVRISSTLEHALDVSEEELPENFVASVLSSVEALRTSIRNAAASSREGKILREGARVVFSGAPNVGKSSLFNALLEESRAIVSDVPGTTRDSIEEWLEIAGWPVCLVDTAGLRDTPDAIESEGVKRAKALAGKADIVLDLSECKSGDLEEVSVASDASYPRRIKVWTKCDLADGKEMPRERGIKVSSSTREGIESLKEEIASVLGEIAESSHGSIADAGADRLQELENLLNEALSSSDIVLLANSVRAVAERLSSIVGAQYSDDLFESLFSRFCVGK